MLNSLSYLNQMCKNLKGEKKEFTFANLIIFLILIIFFIKALLPGNVLSPSGVIFSSPFFADEAPQGLNLAKNPLITDQVFQFYPWRYYSWTSLKTGILPLWNPYSFCGTPFIATMQSAVFYPINLLLNLMPFETIFVISGFVRIWIAGLFSYLLCRRYQLGFLASMVASVSFMLSGYIISWLGFPHVNVAVWLPALIYFSERTIQSTLKRQTILNCIYLSLVIGMQYLGGHIETSIDILFSTGIYYLLRILQQNPLLGWKAALKTLLLRGLVPVILGTGLAAVQLLPFLEWLPLSAEFSSRSSLQFKIIDPNLVYHLLTFPLQFFPNLYNNPSWDSTYWYFIGGWSNFNETAVYIGILSIFFSLIALRGLRYKRSAILVTWFLIFVIAFGRAFRIPPIDWLNYLPGLILGRPERLRLVMSFALSIMAGLGFQATFASHETVRLKLNQIKKYASLAIFAGLIILIVYNMILIPAANNKRMNDVAELRTIDKSTEISTVGPSDVGEISTDVISDHYAELVSSLIYAFRLGNIEMYSSVYICLLFVMVYWMFTLGWINKNALKIIVFCLVIIDLISFGRNFNPVIKSEAFYPNNKTAIEINRDPDLFRTMSLNFDSIPDSHLFYNLSEVRGMDFPTQWINDFFNLTGARIDWISYAAVFETADMPLMKLLNIKYTVSADPTLFAYGTSSQNIGSVWLNRNDYFIPRAWFPEKIVVANDNVIRSALQHITLDRVGKDIYLNENEVDFVSKSLGETMSKIEVIEYSTQYSTWSVQSNQENMLFTSDSFYPGWKAYVDGVETRIHRANLAFRAIQIPAGEHIVEYRFDPLSFKIGAIISLVCLFGISIFLIGTLVTSKHLIAKKITPHNR